MSGRQQRYDLVAQYDGLEGMVQGEGTRVVNMFRYYEEEDPRYCTLYCVLCNAVREHLCHGELRELRDQ